MLLDIYSHGVPTVESLCCYLPSIRLDVFLVPTKNVFDHLGLLFNSSLPYL